MMKEGLQNRYQRRGLQNWEVRRGTKSPHAVFMICQQELEIVKFIKKKTQKSLQI